MENNLETSQPVNPSSQFTQTKMGMNRPMVLLVSISIIAIVLVIFGYTLFLHNAKKPTYNAQVYNQPTIVVTPTVSPVPSIYQVNTKDASDNAINQDAQVAGQNLNNIDSALNNVDQSFNDQQTNLQ
jgi:hypothetical protein